MYKFPKKILRNLEPLDPRTLDSFLQPIADLTQGGLSQHNMTSGSIVWNEVDDEAYYRCNFAEASVDPDFVGSDVPLVGGNGPDATYVALNDKQWNVIDDVTMSVETTESVLWIEGSVQFTYQEWNKLFIYKSAVQFAIRINGQVWPGSITGKQEITEQSWAPFILTNPKNEAGMRTYRYESPTSIGGHHRPVRLGAVIPVSPGTHTVEIVVRRVATPDRFNWIQPDNIECYNRRLFALEIPSITKGTATDPTEVDVPSFDEGEILSKANYETNKLDPIITELNAIVPADMEKGSLNHSHLARALFTGDQTILDGTLTSASNEYPGWGDPTIGDPGWKLMDDGTTDLLVDAGAAGFGISSFGDVWILIMAEIEIKNIQNTTGAPPVPATNDFAMFKFMMNVGGVWQDFAPGSGKTEYSINNDNQDIECEYTLSMMNVVYFKDPGFDIDRIGVFVSTWDGAGTNDDIEVKWRNASIKALILRP